jgi:cytochrome c-type biogenesis protein CcmH/NrfG
VQKGQIALGAGALILVLALYFGGKTTTKKKSETPTAQAGSISFESYEKLKLSGLSGQSAAFSDSLAAAMKAIPASDTANLKKTYLEWVEFWKHEGVSALAGYYYYQYAKTEDTKTSFENAGDVLMDIYKSGSDSIISNNLITFALRSYEAAAAKDNEDIGLKIKTAEVYVQGSQEPMKGITMLRQLADSLPDNVPVLLALGRLSIQSGQYDKAKERLQKVLQLAPQNTEAIYFLAITEAELGHSAEAIRLFELCKMLVGNEEFNKEIDEIIKNLKSKKV